jgi:predicted amidohydrolase
VQLKYHAYEENSIVKITADDAYERKVMAILEAVKTEADIVVFPEFSIPFEYLDKIREYADENGVIVVAGSHYVSGKNLGEYGRLFSREFGEADLRKNISPIIIPSSKIVHNEKFLGAREERPAFFDKGMEIGKINNIFKLRERLNVGVMICYEFLNTELRHRLLPVCDIILVPQTNPKPQSFYKEAESEINRPLGGGTKAFVMANGIFTIGSDKKVTGGSTGVYLTLDKYSDEKKNQGVIIPVDDVMEQFVLIASINTDFYPAWDTETGQESITLKLINVFEEAEIVSKSNERGKEFIKFIEKISSCNKSDELRSLLIKERGSVDNKADEVETSLIKQFSPLMNKRIQDLDELKFEELKEQCCCLVITKN